MIENKKRIVKCRGFTLVEMAVVLVIFGLVLGGLLGPLTAQLEQQRRSETKQRLESARDALYGYTIANGHMPCPDQVSGGSGTSNDTANDGIEDYSSITGNCMTLKGNLPWATLSLPSTDDWGTAIIYGVSSTFSNRSPATPLLSISSVGDQKVCNEAACTAPRLTDSAAAVIISRGPNAGNCVYGTCADELQNGFSDSDTSYVSHNPTANGAGGTEYFDDMVLWLSGPVIISKLVTVGRLP